ncbi:MAG: cupin domain-containing protein [Desulfarculus sp.]|nr:cupin domain-containing protein [Desulfarculus sp.]
MDKESLLKNIPFAEPQVLAEMVRYQPGQVVSRTLAQNAFLSLTLFAFDQGEGISAHSVLADALVLVLDGRAHITIGGQEVQAVAGQAVAMPEGVPHALQAHERFKMLLFVVKRPQKLTLQP